MTLPRILSIGADEFLRQQPAPEFQTLRGVAKTFPNGPLGESPLVLEGLPGDAVEIEAEFSLADSGRFGFELRRSAAGKPGITVAIQRGTLTVGNARAYVGTVERYKLRLFLDKRCLEVYVNDGAVALFAAVDAPPEDQGLAVFAASRPASTVRVESLKAWPMKPASFSLDHFHA
jgi:sucrose-6-phosphate hydrolase SacC (GH32 family)